MFVTINMGAFFLIPAIWVLTFSVSWFFMRKKASGCFAPIAAFTISSTATLIIIVSVQPVSSYWLKRATSLMKPKVWLHQLTKSKNNYKKHTANFEITIASSVNNSIPTTDNKTVAFDDEVELYLQINKNGKTYCDYEPGIAKGVYLPIKLLGKIDVEWFKLEPQYQYYSSTAGFNQVFGTKGEYRNKLKAWFDKAKLNKIFFYESKMGKHTNKTSATLNQKSVTNNSVKLNGRHVGTMRYALVVKLDNKLGLSPGRKELDSGDFKSMALVHRISVKGNTGNTYLDEGFAHCNLPYFWGSDRFSWGWYGSDCAKYVSVVYKESGNNIGYVGTINLYNRKSKAEANSVSSAGYLLQNGNQLRYGKEVNVGDILVRRTNGAGHAGLLGEDLNNNGLLDINDGVLHTSWSAPKYEKIGVTIFGKKASLQKASVKILSE